MELKEANKVMGAVNGHADAIQSKMQEFEAKCLHDRKANLVYEGLRFAHIEMCELIGEIDEMVK